MRKFFKCIFMISGLIIEIIGLGSFIIAWLEYQIESKAVTDSIFGFIFGGDLSLVMFFIMMILMGIVMILIGSLFSK